MELTAVGADALIAGRYQLVESIGSGGMGTVWSAEDRVLDRAVAVKLLRPEFAADERSRRRFRAEARAAASISHPNVVGVFDYGEQSAGNGEWLSFLVMELIQGRSLANELVAKGRLPGAAVTAIIEQTALGLSLAHARGVVHRDIKPANILLSPNRLVKITDFGIARWADATPLTRTGTVVGTAQYLSPEQAEGRDATPKSDLYSLGVVAFACLKGAPPFTRETALATMLAHVRDPVPPLPSDTPAGLRSLVNDLLAKSPGDRPRTDEVAARCRAIHIGSGNRVESSRTVGLESTAALTVADIERRPTGGRPGHQPSTATMVLPGSHPGRRGQRRRALFIGSSAMIALAVAALFVAFAIPSSKVNVPNVVGESVASARNHLTAAGLMVAVRNVDSPGHTAGDVLSENPDAGRSLGKGKVVRLTATSGMVEVAPAAYLGLPYATAASRLAALGVHPIENSVSSAANPGSVLSVSPTGQVPVGSTVTVEVAFTPPATTPPPILPAHGNQGARPDHGHGKGQNS